MLLSFDGKANNQALLKELDNALDMRQQYDATKEKRIVALKAKTKKVSQPQQLLRLYDEIYQEYYVFKLDSALAYASKGYELASKANDIHYQNVFALHRALSLSIGGLYTEALETMKNIHIEGSDHKMLFLYDWTYRTLYMYMAAFCNDKHYQPTYLNLEAENFIKAIQVLSPTDPLYDYYLGEKYLVIDKDYPKAEKLHLSVIGKMKDNTRIYAQACFSLANIYQALGNKDKYEEYLIRSSIADIKNSTKEKKL